MAYDPDLAGRVRAAVTACAARRGLRTGERRMFGSLAFMVGGKMACGVVGEELMARVGPSRHAQALEHPHARPMDFTGRPMTGYALHQPSRLLHRPHAPGMGRASRRPRQHPDPWAILNSGRRWPRTSGAVLPPEQV